MVGASHGLARNKSTSYFGMMTTHPTSLFAIPLHQDDNILYMTNLLRQPAAPTVNAVAQQDITFSSSATLNAQFWIEQFPWRPTSAWAAIAALLLLDFGWQSVVVEWRTIVLVLVLVDPLWGSLWRLAAGRGELLPLQTRVAPHPVWLPYMKENSPAARLFDWNYVRAVPLLFWVGLPSLLLALLVAAVVNPIALWMTGGVFFASVLAWIVRRALQGSASLLHSLVTVTLPALLIITLFQPPDSAFQGQTHWLLIAFWTIHNWGEGRNLRSIADPWGLLLLGVAEMGMISMMIFNQAPLWLAFLVLLWLPTWLAIYQGQRLRRLNFIWLIAMLLSAWAMGQSS